VASFQLMGILVFQHVLTSSLNHSRAHLVQSRHNIPSMLQNMRLLQKEDLHAMSPLMEAGVYGLLSQQQCASPVLQAYHG